MLAYKISRITLMTAMTIQPTGIILIMTKHGEMTITSAVIPLILVWGVWAFVVAVVIRRQSSTPVVSNTPPSK